MTCTGGCQICAFSKRLMDNPKLGQAWSIMDILYCQKGNFSCGTIAGNLQQGRWAHLVDLGSQSKPRIHIILYARG